MKLPADFLAKRKKKKQEQEEFKRLKEEADARDEAMWQELLNFHWDPSKLQCNKGNKMHRVEKMLGPLGDTVHACTMCSLGRQQDFDPHVFSTKNVSRWFIVGQNPGYNECQCGIPFVGDAGKFFNETVEKFGLSRDHFYITNSVKCYTPENRKPSIEESGRCRPFLEIELTLLRPILVITLGAVGFDVFFDDEKMSNHLGSIVHSDKFGVDVYPIYHPSPRNMCVESRKDKFIEDISNLCSLIKEYEKCAKII